MERWFRNVDRKIYLPNEAQRKFENSPAKYRWFVGGAGGGKTTCGAVEAIRTAIAFPGSRGLILRYTYKELIHTTWKEMTSLLLANGLGEEWVKVTTSPQSLRMDWFNGSEILGWNGESWQNMTNLNLDWFWIDQSEEMPDDEVFVELCQRIRGKIGPRRGWCTGYPNGEDWLHSRFVADKPDTIREQKNFVLRYDWVWAPSIVNKANLPDGYIEGLKHDFSNPGDYARKVEAKFLTNQGTVFPSFKSDVHVYDDSEFELKEHWPRYLAIDPGYDPDPAAILFAVVDEMANVFIYRELCLRKMEISDQCKEILRISRHEPEWHIALLDPHANQRNDAVGLNRLQLYAKYGITHLHPGNPDRDAGYETIREFLKWDKDRLHPINLSKQKDRAAAGIHSMGSPQLHVARSCENLIFELRRHRYDKWGKPEKKNDHFLAALRWLLQRKPKAAERRPDGRKINPLWEAFYKSEAKRRSTDHLTPFTDSLLRRGERR